MESDHRSLERNTKELDTALFLTAFAGLFAIMNPFVALPVFLSFTENEAPATQPRQALRVAVYSGVLGLIILFTGTAILGFFGVSVDDFRIAGGIVLLTIGLGMLNGGSRAHSGTASEQRQQAEQQDPTFYPMTFPLLVGPGTITTLVVLSGRADGAAGYLGIGAALLAVVLILAVVLFFSASIGRHMSETLRVIMTRLMGMILAAIAVQMVIEGALKAFPALGK